MSEKKLTLDGLDDFNLDSNPSSVEETKLDTDGSIREAASSAVQSSDKTEELDTSELDVDVGGGLDSALEAAISQAEKDVSDKNSSTSDLDSHQLGQEETGVMMPKDALQGDFNPSDLERSAAFFQPGNTNAAGEQTSNFGTEFTRGRSRFAGLTGRLSAFTSQMESVGDSIKKLFIAAVLLAAAVFGLHTFAPEILSPYVDIDALIAQVTGDVPQELSLEDLPSASVNQRVVDNSNNENVDTGSVSPSDLGELSQDADGSIDMSSANLDDPATAEMGGAEYVDSDAAAEANVSWEDNPYWNLPNKPDQEILPPINPWTAGHEQLWRQKLNSRFLYQKYKVLEEIDEARLAGSEVLLWELAKGPKLWLRLKALMLLSDMGQEVAMRDVFDAIDGEFPDTVANFLKRFKEDSTPGQKYIIRHLVKIVGDRARANAIDAIAKSETPISNLYLVAGRFDPSLQVAGVAANYTSGMQEEEFNAYASVVQGLSGFSEFEKSLENEMQTESEQNQYLPETSEQNLAADDEAGSGEVSSDEAGSVEEGGYMEIEEEIEFEEDVEFE